MMKRRDELLMKTLFLSSSGLNESTSDVFWKCIKKEPADTKVIYVPSAAVENDGAREGIALCAEGLMNMGIPFENILIYELSLLISAGNFSNGLGYLTNHIIPHAEEGTPCGEVPSDKPIKTADGQVIVIQGDRKKIIC